MFVRTPGALNPEQEFVIDEPDSVFLIACPGSGKTRTLTYKVASELTKLDTHRQFVAAITYTHRAADEIEERIMDLGVDTDQLWIGTIHSFCLEWILRPYGIYHPDLAKGFRVIGSHERETLLQRLCAPYTSPRISVYDCDFYFTGESFELGSQTPAKHPSIRNILEQYFEELKRARQVDFELILYYAHQLVVAQPQISKILSNIFSFIAIDEYQDTKLIQYEIVASILRAGAGRTRTLIVGDPNQAIFASLGGFAMAVDAFRAQINVPLKELQLSQNYRSSSKIIDYFGNYNVHGTTIEAASKIKDFASLVTFNNEVVRDSLEDELVRLIRHNIEVLGIDPSEICVLAPWWVHLAGMTRRLVTRLPEYEFDGPGMVPFAHDMENIYYKLARLALTEASPGMYVRRLRWANEVLIELSAAGVDVARFDKRVLLRESNAVVISETDGLGYLTTYFDQLFERLEIDRDAFPSLMEQRTSFFESSQVRIDRMTKDGAEFISDIETFRRVFRSRSGITVSTIHGIKGAEFDTVIAYALLDGMVPHFNDAEQINSGKKLLYVIGSRARKHLHLVAERGRERGGSWPDYDTAVPLKRLSFAYDTL